MSIATRLFRHTHPIVAALPTDLSSVRPRSPLLWDDRYRVFDAPSGDAPGGPMHQPGVMPGAGYEALRTPCGDSGIPGAGHERNVTDLNLAVNQHPHGYLFAAANGRNFRQVPSMHGQ